MTKNNPTFSIIVPCYNVENYITECINSILEQTFTDFEILCVDDCGSDSTMDIIALKKDPRIRIIKHRKNKGLGAARNSALKKAKGKYIICVDSDDYILPNCLKKVYEKFQETNLDVIWFKANLYNQATDECSAYNNYPIFSQTQEGRILLNDENLINFPLVSWNKAYNREFLLNHNILWTEGKLFEDVEFFWKVHTNLNEVYLLDKPFYVYRRRRGSICVGGDFVKKVSDIYDVTVLVYKYLRETNKFTKYKKQFMRYVLDTLREHRYDLNNIKKYATLNLKYLEEINYSVL